MESTSLANNNNDNNTLDSTKKRKFESKEGELPSTPLYVLTYGSCLIPVSKGEVSQRFSIFKAFAFDSYVHIYLVIGLLVFTFSISPTVCICPQHRKFV